MAIKIGMQPIDATLPWKTVAPASLGLGDRVDLETDGVADDVQINAMYQAARLGAGVLVYPGDYALTASILVNRTGVGLWSPCAHWPDSRFIISANVPAILIGGVSAATTTNYTFVSGIATTGTGGGTAQDGFAVEYCNMWSLHKCLARGMGGNGFRFGRSVTNTAPFLGDVYSCWSQSNAQNGVLVGAEANAINWYGGRIQSNTLRGYYTHPDGGATPSGCGCFGVTIEGNTRGGLVLNSAAAFTWSGGYFELNGNGTEGQIILGEAVGAGCRGLDIAPGVVAGGSSKGIGIEVLDCRQSRIAPGRIYGHTVRNIDVGTTGGGRTCDSNRVIFAEDPVDFVGAQVVSRNQGGATEFRNYHYGVKQFDDLDTTPDVGGADAFTATNSLATSITTFDGGHSGKTIRVYFSNGNTTLVDGATLQLSGGVNYNPPANTVMWFTQQGAAAWYEMSRSND